MTLLDSSDKTIGTARLELRQLREGDDARIFALFSNWNVMRFLSSPPPPSRYTADDALIGIIDMFVKPASIVQRENGYSLGYWIGEPYWGHGYMTEAARAFLEHVFTRIPDNTIYSGAFAENVASLRIQEKLGFVRDSEAMFFARPAGKEMPHVSTSITRAQFAASVR